MNAPVLVLKDSLKRESGTKVHHANIQASKSVSDILRTTLGPSSMLKMLLDAGGGIIVTNDGNAILREIDVAHPAAKSMIELSRTQDEEVGDGTTSVIVLAGEMLHVAESFLEKSYHPTVICRAYNKALEDAIAVLDKIAMPIDVSDRATVLGLVKSCIGTKFTSKFGDLIAVGKRLSLQRAMDKDKRSKLDVFKMQDYAEGSKVCHSLIVFPIPDFHDFWTQDSSLS